jgi:predicted phosphodiesterase
VTSKHICVAILATSAFAGCGFNQSGNISAPKDGDRANLAERSSPLQAHVDACGPGGDMPNVSTVTRQPYLQQMATDSVIVGWVTTHPAGARVELSTPAGAPLGTTNAEEERTLTPGPDQHQMWTKLTGLTPDTAYCYAVYDSSGQATARTGFRTAPAADSTKPVRFLVLGDSGGGGTDQYALRDQMDTVPFDLMLHIGDLAYDNGTMQELEDKVFGVYADVLKNIPLFPIAGNHEYNTGKAAPYRAVFNLPAYGGENYYSYDWGRVHFAAIDTEQDYASQIAWLDRDLAASDALWKIVYTHKPPYSSGEHGSDTKLRALLEPVVQKHGVQLVLSGHDHDYERMKPQHGVNYIVTGGGGVGTRPVGSSDFTAFSAEVIQLAYGEVFDDKLVLHVIDATGREFDSLVIPKTPAAR